MEASSGGINLPRAASAASLIEYHETTLPPKAAFYRTVQP